MMDKSNEHTFPEPTAAISEPSIGFVTMHKAGSVFVDQVLSQLTGPMGFEHIDLAFQAFQMGRSEHLYCVAQDQVLSTPRCYFRPFSRPIYTEDRGTSSAFVWSLKCATHETV